MALTATLHTFDVTLSDVDRGVYETLAVRAAQHPSETPEYLWTRVLAYCLEYTEGIAFSKGGLSDTDEPPVVVRDLTGALTRWIEIGAPDAARLHKASKASPSVVVYSHRDPMTLRRLWDGEKIHRAESIPCHLIDRELLAELSSRLERRMKLTMSVSDRELYVTIGDETVSGAIETISVAG
jgi:uncharacterized protein YaeQ